MGGKMEAFDPKGWSWRKVTNVEPGKKAMISQNLPNGERKFYLFECQRNNKKSLLQETSGDNVTIENEIASLKENKEVEFVTELQEGDEAYLLTVKTDDVNGRYLTRFFHERD